MKCLILYLNISSNYCFFLEEYNFFYIINDLNKHDFSFQNYMFL